MPWAPGIGERSERLVQFRTTTVTPRDGYDVVRTTDQPGYHFGNLMVLHRPPAPEDLPWLLAAWREELGAVEGIQRVVLSTEVPPGAPPPALVAAAAAHGLEVEVDEILRLGAFRPREPRVAVAIRPVVPAEWERIVAFHASEEADGAPSFRRWQTGSYRPLLDDGVGRWWAAWRDGEPVGSAGLFRGEGVARYQQVLVGARHRGAGIASALVSAMAADHLAGPEPDTPLIIVAERGSQAERIYTAIGFTPVATFWSLIGPVPPAP